MAAVPAALNGDDNGAAAVTDEETAAVAGFALQPQSQKRPQSRVMKWTPKAARSEVV